MSETFVRSVAQDGPLSGSLQPEFKACGKPGCRCAVGALHGPYWYRRWREGGRQRRRYIRREEVRRAREALAAWTRLHPRPWATRAGLAELRRIADQVLAEGD
jgi:hypothetical protein